MSAAYGRRAARVAVAGRNQHRAAGPREVPQPRQRQAVGEQVGDDPAEQPHLHIGMRHANPLEVDGLEEDVVGAIARPGRRGRARRTPDRPGARTPCCAPDRSPRGGAAELHHRRTISPTASREAYSSATAVRAGEVVLVGRALEGQGDVLEPGARPGLVDEQVAVGRRCRPRSRDPEDAVQLRIGAHRHQPPAAVHVTVSDGDLPRRPGRERQFRPEPPAGTPINVQR